LVDLKSRFQQLPEQLKERPASVAHVVAAVQVLLEKLDIILSEIDKAPEDSVVTAEGCHGDEAAGLHADDV